MKSKAYYIIILSFFSFILSCGITACSEEEYVDFQELDSNSLYLRLNLSLDSSDSNVSTRDDEENADKDTYIADYNENIISAMRLFFCTVEESGEETCEMMITHNSAVDFNTGTEKSATVSIELNPKELIPLAGKNKVKVYFVGNFENGEYIKDIKNFNAATAKTTNIWSSWLNEYSTGGMSQPLVNSEFLELDFSSLTTNDINNFIAGKDTEKEKFKEIAQRVRNTFSKITENKTLKLERLYARVDYADGSQKGDNVYPLHYDSEENQEIYLKIESLEPINVGKYCYIFRHTSSNAIEDSNSTEINLFDGEGEVADGSFKWIIDSDYAEKLNYVKNNSNNNPGFLYKYIDQKGAITSANGLSKTEISKLMGSSHYSYTIDNKTYYPWRYYSENILPSNETMIKGLCSGIAIRVLLCDEKGDALTVFPEGFTYEDNKIKQNEEEAPVEYSGGKYYLTYYYFFRHNYNKTSHSEGTIDPMKFGIVRNHVYRISIKGFDGLPAAFSHKDPIGSSTKSTRSHIDVSGVLK